MGYGVSGMGKLAGVYGEPSAAASDSGAGGYFRSDKANGQGVFGFATGVTGKAVFGHASNTSTSAINYGGYFTALGKAAGTGVYGEGEVEGVRGKGKVYSFYAYGPAGSVDYATFTGAHEAKLDANFPPEVLPGMIVSVTGAVEMRRDDGEVNISSTLPTVKLAVTANDKAVFGVLVAHTKLPQEHWYQPADGERFATVNAVGEGRVWVCDVSGPIEAGDYITTSLVSGYGQKQADDLLHSYTVGKAIETVDWDSVTETVEYGGAQHKVYLIAVVYTSG